MTDAQSIEDLLKKKTETQGPKKLSSEQSPGEKFSDKIATMRLKEKEIEIERAASAAGFSYANLAGFPITADAISTIAREQAEKLRTICFVNTGDEIRLGAIDPTIPEIEEIRFQLAERTHANVVVYMVSQHSFEIGLHVYDILPSVRKITKGVSISDDDIKRFTDIHSFDRLQAALAGANVTDIVVILIAASLNTRSSDIHVEAEENAITIRFRIDGILTKVASIPASEWIRMISRIKLISGLKINVTDQPQDGRFTISLAKEKIDVRVSTIPTALANQSSCACYDRARPGYSSNPWVCARPMTPF